MSRRLRQAEQELGRGAVLNLYSLVTDPMRTSAHVENDYYDLVRALKHSLRVPLAVNYPISSPLQRISLGVSIWQGQTR